MKKSITQNILKKVGICLTLAGVPALASLTPLFLSWFLWMVQVLIVFRTTHPPDKE